MLPHHLVCKYELNCEYCNIILERNKAPWWWSDKIETCRCFNVLKVFYVKLYVHLLVKELKWFWRTATCFEISENLGNVISLYWLVLRDVSDCALTFSVHEVVVVLVLFTLLHADMLQSLTPFTPVEIWLPDSETAGPTWPVGWPISFTLIVVLVCREVQTADAAWLQLSFALIFPISEFNFWINDW